MSSYDQASTTTLMGLSSESSLSNKSSMMPSTSIESFEAELLSSAGASSTVISILSDALDRQNL